MEKFLEHLISHVLENDDEDVKVVRTVPVKKSWEIKLKAWKDEVEKLKEMTDELEKAFHKMCSKKKAFWVEVEEDLGEYGPMRLNEDKTEVEILESK